MAAVVAGKKAEKNLHTLHNSPTEPNAHTLYTQTHTHTHIYNYTHHPQVHKQRVVQTSLSMLVLKLAAAAAADDTKKSPVPPD